MLEKKSIPLLLSLLFCTISFSFAQTNHQHFASHFILNTDKKNKTKASQEKRQLTLQSKAIDTHITGFIAAVTVKEVYQNETDQALNATYIVPTILPEGSLHDLSISIGARIIQTNIVKNDQVLKANSERYSTKLLTPQLIEVSVPDIAADQKVEVTLFYTQKLTAQSKGTYQFVYPKLPQPILEEAILSRLNDKDLGIPKEAEFDENTPLPLALGMEEDIPTFEPKVGFTFKATITGAIQPNSLKSRTYDDLEVDTDTQQNTTTVSYQASINRAYDRNFEMEYTLSQKESFATNLWLSEGNKKDTTDNYFMLSVHAPQQANKVELLPNEYVFVLDLSNSIPEKSITNIKDLFKSLPKKAAKNSLFNILLLDEKATMFREQSLSINAENIENALAFLTKNRGGFNGKVSTAIEKILNEKSTLEKNSSHKSIVIVTDGRLRLDKMTHDLLVKNAAKTSVFALGLGRQPNAYFINGLAHFANTKPFIINDLSTSSKVIDEFGDYLTQGVLKDVTVRYEGIEVYDVLYQNKTNRLYADQPLVLLGKYKNKALDATITIDGKNDWMAQAFSQKIKVMDEANAVKQQTISYLWAGTKVKLLNDYNVLVYQKNRKGKKYRQQFQDNKAKVQQLGIEHQILNDYTKYEIKDSRDQSTETQLDWSKKEVDEAFLNKAVNEKTPDLDESSPLMLSYYMDEGTFVEELPNYSTCLEVGFLDNYPKFPGGLNKLYHFIQNNRQVTENQANSGSVWVSLLVNPDGSVSDIEVEHSTNETLNEVAVSLIKKMPNWKPAVKSGKAVDTRWSLPIPISF